MSMLKKLKKNERKETGTVLKGGIVLLFDSQEEFDQLATLFPEIADSISIDGDYCAYMDEYPALQVCPLSEFSEDIDNFLEACRHKNLKPMDFSNWYKKNK